MNPKKVFVIGELNVDLIMKGNDVIPQFNQEKVVDHFDMVLGSSSAITACGLAGLGLDVYFVSVIGQDSFGDFCISELKNKGVNTQYVKVVPNLKTGVTLSLSTSEDRALVTYMGSISSVQPDDIPESIFNMADHIHFGSFYLQEKMMNHWKTIFKIAQENGISTSFDVGWDPEEKWHRKEVKELLQFTTLFMPNETEIMNIFNIQGIDQLPEHLPEKYGAIAVKLGSKGSMLINEDNSIKSKPSFPINPIDTTGAGDSFNAGVIFGYLTNMEIDKVLTFANACGAMATLRIGGASSVPTIHDVEKFINSFQTI